MITVHLAARFERKRADAVVRRVYARQGLGNHGLPDIGDTFIVCDGHHLAGTLSLVMDTSAGLPADDLFQTELDTLRAGHARLCELSRFALETQLPSAKLFDDLFRTIHRHLLHNYDCTDVILQADPPHCAFYRRRLGFKPLGAAVTHPTYNAPAQLMRIHVFDLTRHFRRAHEVRGPGAQQHRHDSFRVG